MPFSIRPRKIVSVSLTAILSLAYCGCGPSQQEVHQKDFNSTMNSWMGHQRNDLLRSLGPPTNETSLSNGGRILSYRREWGQVVLGNIEVVPPRVCQQDFETNSAGTIVRLRSEGQC